MKTSTMRIITTEDQYTSSEIFPNGENLRSPFEVIYLHDACPLLPVSLIHCIMTTNTFTEPL